MVYASVLSFSEWIITCIDAKPYNSMLIASACICTLCIARYLTLNSRISMKHAINSSYCMVYASVLSFREWIITRIDVKPYNNMLIASACICTLCIAIHLMLNIGI